MALSVVFFFLWENRKREQAESKSERILTHADSKKDLILRDARKESEDIISDAKKQADIIQNNAQKTEERIAKAETRVLEREEKIESRLDEIQKQQDNLAAQEEKLQADKEALKQKSQELDGKLSEIAELSQEEARSLYLQEIAELYERDAKRLIEKHKKKIDKQKIEISREILLSSIQKYAGDVTSEVTTTLIPIPGDDIKGKLIGKEGRNITTFERNAGVSLIIDDTPDSVFISAFDLYRRYIAKKSLEKLIEDGRIQPARIEEVIEATLQE